MAMSERQGKSDFDAAIIGAGPSGSATARWLSQQGLRVALIERSRFDVPRVGESLAPAVQLLLAELGVWDKFLALKPLPSHGTRSLWGDATPLVHSHVMSPWGCGWHVDRLAFDRMLMEAAGDAGAALFCGTTLVRCDESADGWVLELQKHDVDGQEPEAFGMRAKVVIDASGRASRFTRWVGAQRFSLDHLVSIATQFTGVDTAHEGYVMVEATADGWWYTAPVPDGRIMAMLMTDGDLCGRSDLASSQAWWGRLQAAEATRARVAGCTPSWGPRVFSAISHRLRRCEQCRPWLAVGDAALAVDPISGSGVVRALRSAHACAETALALIDRPTQHAIEAYETDRDREFTAYLQERALYYSIERRWEESEFWQRRAVGFASANSMM